MADRHVQPLEHERHTDVDGLGGLALPDQPGPALDLADAGLALVTCGAEQLVGPAVQGTRALLTGAQREPGVHLGLARGPRGLGELLAVVGELLGVRVLGAGEPRLEVAETGEVPLAGASLASVIARSKRAASPRAARAWAPN